MSTVSNNPSLVAKALAKALSVESRLNSLIGVNMGTPQTPTIMYSSSGGPTVITASSDGTYTWTCPAGVTQAIIECWGAGAGGNGSGTGEGGPGGGGGEYAQEPAMVVVPGTVYTYVVGNGGSGAPAGQASTSGGDSFFNFNGPVGISVYANGGNSNNGSFVGGLGGTGSSNTIAFPGGAGGGDNSQSTGGCGGGGSGGSTGAGGSGTDSSSSTGTAGGAAGTGGGAAGGAGGNSAANGSSGSAPGAGGGGCGAATSVSISKTYNCTGTRSYYGADASASLVNKTRSTNSTMWQGGTTSGGGTANGTQKCIITFPTAPNIVSDFSGASVTSCVFTLTNAHTFYSTGMNLNVKTWLAGGGAPTTWNGSSSSSFLFNPTIGEGQTKSFSLGAAVGAGFAAGTNFGIALGPGGPNLDNFWYGYFYGGINTYYPIPTLTLTGTTGATVTGGAGSDGQVRITYTPPTTALVAAVQPAATTDAAGNALAAGVTVAPSAGTTSGIVAVQPGSSPAVLETWHAVTGGVGYQNSWTDTTLKGQYKLTGDNCVHIVGTLVPGVTTNGTTMFTLPTAYRPNKQVCAPVGAQGSVATFNPNVPGLFISVETNGNVDIFGANPPSGSVTFVHVNALIPLDTLN